MKSFALFAAFATLAACSRQAEPESTTTSATPSSASSTLTPSSTSTPSSTPAPTPTPSSDDPALSSFCSDAYGADLEQLRKKCSADELAAPEGMTRTAAKLCTRDLAQLASRKNSTFDPAVAKQCVAAIKNAPEKKPIEGETFFSRPPCDLVVTGKVGEGRACRWPPECKDGLACDGYKVGVDGTCKKLAAIGAKCSAQAFGGVFNEMALALHHGPCAKGAYCEAGTCVARGAAGAPCARTSTCSDGLTCYMSKCSKGGLAAAGGACSRTADCALALYCDTTTSATGKCAEKKSAGSVCTNDECKGYCDIPKNEKTGKCLSTCGSG